MQLVFGWDTSHADRVASCQNLTRLEFSVGYWRIVPIVNVNEHRDHNIFILSLAKSVESNNGIIFSR